MLSTLSKRTRIALLGIAGAGLLLGLGVNLFRRQGTGTTEPIDAVPRDAFLVATVQLAELRRSPIYEIIFGRAEASPAGGRPDNALLDPKALGLTKLAEGCGFDPLSRVDALAVAVPEEGDKGELGVAARVTVTEEELRTCASALADRKGAAASVKEIGGFSVIENSASEGAARPRLAYGHGGLLVVGRGAWFDAMLATADGKRPGIKEANTHVALRNALTSREGWRTPTVLVTALLPRALRDRIKNEMGAELGAQDTAAATMAGVLGVHAAGLALRAGARGQNIDVAVDLACDLEDACAAVEKLIVRKRFELSKELTLRMVGLGPLLDSVEVTRESREGVHLRITASAAADPLSASLERILRFKLGAGAPPPAAPRDPTPPIAASADASVPRAKRPDESIPARTPPDASRP